MISTSRRCSLTTWQNRSCLVSLVHQLGEMAKGDCCKTERETSIIHSYYYLSYNNKKMSIITSIIHNTIYICTCSCIMYLHVLSPCYIACVFVHVCTENDDWAKALLGMRKAVEAARKSDLLCRRWGATRFVFPAQQLRNQRKQKELGSALRRSSKLCGFVSIFQTIFWSKPA